MIERLRVRIPAGAAGEFSSPELSLCANSYSVSVPPRITAEARKRSRSVCKKCKWQVTPKHASTIDPTKSELAENAVQESVWELIRETSSHATRQGTLGHGQLSSLSHCGLILALQKWHWNVPADLHLKKILKNAGGE